MKTAVDKHRSPYIRLGRKIGLWGQHFLWLGEDHLLQVFTNGGSERYQRFYFRDIRAILISKPSGRVGIFAVLSGIALAIAFILLVISRSPADLLAVAVTLLLFVAATSRDKPFECRVITAVCQEPLRALSKPKGVDRALALIRARIALTQGAFPEDAKIRYMHDLSSLRQEPVRSPAVSAGEPAEKMRHERGRVHEAGFYLLLLAGLTEAVNIFYEGMALSLAGLSIEFIACGVLIAALVRGRRSDIPESLHGIVRASVIYGGVYLFIGYFCLVMAVSVMTEFNLQALYRELPPSIRTWPLLIARINAVIVSALAVAGLLRLYLFRRRTERAAP